jgi:hypothetical protein
VVKGKRGLYLGKEEKKYIKNNNKKKKILILQCQILKNL